MTATEQDRRKPAPWAVALVIALAALSLIWAVGAGKKPRQAIQPKEAAVRKTPSTWKEVDRLVGEQKFEEAAKIAEAILLSARERKDADEWARALVKVTQLRTGLHGYETAVRFLMEQEWPEGALPRAALNLFYARSVVIYAQAYSWEIGQRERVESAAAVDLKAWTRDQLYKEAQRAYLEVWKERDALGAVPISRFAEYLDANDYPKGVRDTMRDAVSYLFAELLSDTSLWRPEEEAEVFRLDLKGLLKSAGESASLADPAVHPLAKACSILGDLEGWHAKAGRREAELEARLERHRNLWSAFDEEEADRDLIRASVETLLPAYRDVSWWSVGMADLAEFTSQGDKPGRLVRSRAIAEEGLQAYPGSVGGQRCLHIVKRIEAPDFSLLAMSSDGPNRRSIQVAHKNLAALHFRAYEVDLPKRIAAAKDYNLLPHWREVQEILRSQSPSSAWTADLPGTPDFDSHKTFVAPSLKKPGLYLVAASARKDFAEKGNRILGVNFLLTGLVLVTRQEAGGGIEAAVLSGESGEPVSGATVDLYRYDWNQGHQRVERHTTGADGRARYLTGGEKQGRSHFLLARKGENYALDQQYINFYQRQPPQDYSASLVYTDRSIYRPNQKIFWKVLVYQSREGRKRFEVSPAATVAVSLHDPNGEKVADATAVTNSFGSASGEFAVPAGRLLGQWRIQASYPGSAIVRVEEYKRPTFEVSFKDPDSPLRLNRPATLKGEVKYYFGLPVVNGRVKWRVKREPVYPWWWGWCGWLRPAPSGGGQTVASGASELDENGAFSLTFTPEADERKAEDKAITYRYSITADATDEGGETRSATRAFRLGFISVEARIDSEAGFFREGEKGSFRISRSDLNGTPRPGKGAWRLTALKQPDKTLLPADQPPSEPPRESEGEGDFETPGDRLRPRWDSSYSPQGVMRAWEDGGEKGKGSLEHGEGGEAEISLPSLPPGAYRLRYETADDFGKRYETQREFVVAGKRTPLALPLLLWAESSSVKPGGTARFFAHSGIDGQKVFLEVYRDGLLSERRAVAAGSAPSLIEFPIEDADRGGFSVRLVALRDHQFMQFQENLFVPWDDKGLKVEFATFRDKMRPGGKETWRVTVKPAQPGARQATPGSGDSAAASSSPGLAARDSALSPESGTAELLAYMYDRSLDIFAPHHPPSPTSVYPSRTGLDYLRASLGSSSAVYQEDWAFAPLPGYPSLTGDRLKFYDGYGIGGPGRRGRGGYEMGLAGAMAPAPAAAPPMERQMAKMSRADAPETKEERDAATGNENVFALDGLTTAGEAPAKEPETPVPLRSNFAETAFWQPHLITDADGSASIEFTVPDSVTSWNVWVHAVTKDLRAGSIKKEARSVKDLMVRPYLPRFLREGDQAELKVVVNNASEEELAGTLSFDILDAETQESLLEEFGLGAAPVQKPFTVKAGGGSDVTFPITAPKRPGLLAFKVTARAGELSDGELRPIPLLPGRMHLMQSRFVTLREGERREMTFEDFAKADDPTLLNEQMVVTVDAQLFYQVLEALPYLVNYPYECTEQTLNRFVSTGIVSGLYDRYPAVGRMAKELSKRETPLETWDSKDPNRKMALEETPWLVEARGGDDHGFGVTNVLDPRIAKAEREASLAKLKKAQTSLGAFPWWPGGPPSPYMTLYIMHGFAKAAEFGVDVPKEVVQNGWRYLARHFREEYASRMIKDDCCWEFLTFLNYTASCYPDPSWTGDALTEKERKEILAHCFKHWKRHSPYLKGLLALTLKRMGRPGDAKLVFDSVMDSSKTTRDEGTFWAPEDRSWLWYNDTIETHAFALRTLTELSPADPKREGLVQWLFLNKKLNHWKSTRATAEVIYSLAHYLKSENALGVRESAKVSLCNQTMTFVFDPDKYTGKKNQVVVPGEKMSPETCSTVSVEKEGKGFAFASATWHFSTDKMPEEARGDFFSVTRSYFKREVSGKEAVLKPLQEGAELKVGDELEVHLSLRSKHAAEYVHLRDPRGAGFEPENAISRYRWDLGISWYEEVRDSGANFFFEYLPVGEYTFKYRVRASMAGTFKAGPATVQGMYAPEFAAYSSGAILAVSQD